MEIWLEEGRFKEDILEQIDIILGTLSRSSELIGFKLAVGKFLPDDDFLGHVRCSSAKSKIKARTAPSAKYKELNFAWSCRSWLKAELERGCPYYDDEIRTWEEWERY